MSTRLAAALISGYLFSISCAIAQILPPGEQPPPAAGGGGQTAILQTISPVEIKEILQDLGLQSEVTKVGKQPALRVANWRAYNVLVLFRDCKSDVCHALEMAAWFNAPDFANLQWANKWHQKWAYARITLYDKKRFAFQMYVNCRGGVTRDNIIANLKMYDAQLVNLFGKK
jgi:hypothetical protein